MKLKVEPYLTSIKELEEITGCDCKMQFDNKGYSLSNRNIIAELYADKKDAEQIIKQVNLYDDLVEAVARNLVAWDTSIDKREGMLPEIYQRSQSLYKKITGEEYNFISACKRFHINNE